MAAEPTQPELTTAADRAVETAERPFGPAAAVLLATGIGALVLGLLTTLSEASTGIHDFLQFYDRVGPLSGKTIIAGAIFFCAWGCLGTALRRANPPFRPVIIATAILLVIGFVMTFPIFFQAFTAE
jgi:hypothetical protein